MKLKVIATVSALALPVLLGSAAPASGAAQQKPAQEKPAQARPAEAQEVKGAARSTGTAIKDSWISMKVHSMFVPENALEDSDIDVDTKAGVVTLTGTVATAAGKARAVAIAKGADGVKSVSDKLRIGPVADMAREAGRETGAAAREAGRETGAAAREAGRDTKDAAKGAAGTTGKAMSDGWIKSKIASQFVTENALDNSDIDIDISRGAVTLNGAVRTAAARTRAAAIATATDGVRSVKNNLKVDAGVDR